MHFNTLALVIGLAASAQAQVVYKLPTTLGHIAPISLPSRPVVPMSLPTVNATIAVPTIKTPVKPAIAPVVVTRISPVSLPVYPAPAIGPARLPAPSIIEEPYFIDWSLLDGKDGDAPATALIPNDPGPRPLSPAGAVNALRDAVHGRDPIRMPAELFDGAKKTSPRELELPHNRYF